VEIVRPLVDRGGALQLVDGSIGALRRKVIHRAADQHAKGLQVLDLVLGVCATRTASPGSGNADVAQASQARKRLGIGLRRARFGRRSQAAPGTTQFCRHAARDVRPRTRHVVLLRTVSA
jgi:hypothetical protein